MTTEDVTDIELDKMSLDELRRLQKMIDKAIDAYEKRKRIEALAALEAKAREMGFNLSDLTGSSKSRAGGVPRYVHPENPALTWTGRGRKPNWIKEGLQSGKNLEDFSII